MSTITARRRRRARWTIARRAADYLLRFNIPGQHHTVWGAK